MSTFLKLTAGCAVLGALVGFGISFTTAERYTSVAAVRVALPPGEVYARLQRAQQDIFSRANLAELIQRPSLDLYREERRRYPVEEIIDRMRAQDLRTQPATSPATFTLAFSYRDRYKAQAVVNAMLAQFRQQVGENLTVLDPASLPQTPIDTDRASFAANGFGAGLAAGILIAVLRRRTLRWIVCMAASAIAAGAVAFAVSIFFPNRFTYDRMTIEFTALGALTGLAICAFFMRAPLGGANRALHYAIRGAVAVGILAGFGAFAVPDRYVSTAAMRGLLLQDTGTPVSSDGGEVRERLHEITMQVLSRSSLAEVIQRPSLDLYRVERSRRPMEDIIQEMRNRSLRIEQVGASGISGLSPALVFVLSFEYPDRYKAQAVVREFVTKVTELNVTLQRDTNREFPRIVMEVIDPANLPESPVSPDRLRIAACGLGAGALLGVLVSLAGRPPAVACMKYAIAAGALGALIAGAVSFALPQRYVSSAVLRVGPSANTVSPEERLQQLMIEVLGNESLGEIIRQPSVDLYRDRRPRAPMEDIIRQMRDRDLSVQSLEVAPAGGRTSVFRIAFSYPDRAKAYACVQALVTKFVEPRRFEESGPTGIEVLDPASVPAAATSPDRMSIAGVGLFAGVLIGIATALLRRPALRGAQPAGA